MHPLSVVGARAARRGWAMGQGSAFPRGPGCPPPCPRLPPRGWQMLFHQPRRVGGLRKVLLGGSGGQRGRGQLPPSRGWLTAASEDLQSQGSGVMPLDPAALPPHPRPPLPTERLGSGPLWSLAAPAEPPGKAGEEAQHAQHSGCPCSQVFVRAVRDRHVGNLVHVGLGEAAGRAGGQGGLEGAASWPAGPCRAMAPPWTCAARGSETDPARAPVTELTLGKGRPVSRSQAGILVVPDCGLQEIAAVMPPPAWHNLFPGQGPAGADWRSLVLPGLGEEEAG